MKKCKILLILLALLALLALSATPLAEAQPAPGVHRIGFLALRSLSTPSNPDALYDAFVKGMRDLGYVEGRNLAIEWRFANNKNDLLPGLAAELVRANVEVIVTHYSPAAQILQRLTKTIPIVHTACNDPIASGFAASLARPGGNVTGMSLLTIDLGAKQLELLRDMVVGLSRVAVLVSPNQINHDAIVKSIQTAAQQLKISVLPVAAGTVHDLEGAFASMSREKVGAAIIVTDAFFTGQLKQIAMLSTKNRIPSIYAYRFAEEGGLMTYGLDILESHQRAATYVDKIFKGAKAGELPFEQPTRIYLAINLKTAKALGIKIPESLLLRADRVIE
jgi:putative ABC transport system substrate-binding protein